MSRFRWLLATLVAVAFAPVSLLAQEPAVVTGRVVNASGGPENAVLVRIEALNVGTTTAADGSYRLVVPASRVRAGQQVTVTASRVGLAAASRTITLSPGAQLTQNFQLGSDVLRLGEIVATGQGTATTRARATSTVNVVSAQSIQESRENNVVAALAGKAPNVLVTSSSGDPGAGAYIQIRGAASVVGGTQPLFVVDGSPIDNGSYRIESGLAGTATQNRAADINPNDIADIQILKGGAATALYGSRGANGVVLITTKSGRAGQTRVAFNTSYSSDEVNKVVPLQTEFGRGFNCAPLSEPSDPCTVNDLVGTTATTSRSWGAPIPAGTPVYDHAREMYQTGNRLESNLTLSGGTERTTYYLSAGRLHQDGVIIGPQAYDRTTVRLKGTHNFAENLTVGGNFAFTKGSGDFVQQGSNTSGIQLGALRTTPTFNNDGGVPGAPWADAGSGLHRSYRCFSAACTGSLTTSRGYDNPFWVAMMMPNTSAVDRTFGNVNLDYAPASWLRLSYVLGADYSLDNRRTVLPKTSSDNILGRMIRADIETFQIESRLVATLSHNFSENAVGTLSLGQNLNQDKFSQYQVNAINLVYGAEQLDFAVDKVPTEFRSTTRGDGYFANGELTLFDQLTLNGNILNEGSSTFGGVGKRFWYPGFGLSWQVSKLPAFDNLGFLDQLKVRASYGVSGRQPPFGSNEGGYNIANVIDGWVNVGNQTIFAGNDGLLTDPTQGNPDIRPEKKKEWEAGFDLAVLGGRAALGFTYYNRITSDMILGVPLPSSSGYSTQFRNAARVDNHGIEATLDLNPIQRDNFGWQINTSFARNRSCVKDLGGTEQITLAGFEGSVTAVVAPDPVTGQCYPFGAFYGYDWVRTGRGSLDQNTGEDIDAANPSAPAGAIYIGADGFPQLDPQQRAFGNPNPDWTASFRNTFTLFGNLRLSGLVDVSQGGQMWNGTKGALFSFGTHAETLPFQGEGIVAAFGGAGPYSSWTVAGPGAGMEVPLNWYTWAEESLGNGFNGPFTQFVEDASFVKLRDVSLSYTFDQPSLRRRFGISSLNLTVSGRNLKTWTDYTGIDPESNLTGQSVGRGLDYFNNPQTRSWVISVNLNR